VPARLINIKYNYTCWKGR